MRDEPRSVLTFVPPAAAVDYDGRRDEVRCSQINAEKQAVPVMTALLRGQLAR
jgi:hypothetical protein